MVATVNASTSAGVVITPDNSGVLAFQSSSATALTIDASQNVGIGTASPTTYGASTKLAVVSSSTAKSWFVGGSSSGAYAYFSNNAQTTETNTFQIGQGWGSGSDNIGFLNTNGTNPMLFATNGTERMRIDSSGNLLYNTTSTTLYSASTNGTGGINFRSGGSSGNGVIDIARTSDFSLNLNRLSSTGGIVNLIYNGTSVGTISVTGSATAYNTSSDYRLKQNITPMTGALAKVALLKPVTFKWKIDGSNSEGFIAHELQAIKPDCVTGVKDAVDADGKPVHQGVDTSFLVATLTAAIQELKTINDTLTARIVALENR